MVRPSAEEPTSVLEEVRDMFEVQADEAQVSLTVGPVSDVLVHMDHDRVVQGASKLGGQCSPFHSGRWNDHVEWGGSR